ncbi:MAG: thiamine-phosphate pyrophosphorylase [Sphingomonadales bacterium]|jgi:thiamine-phosphate pyrophosphorylase|nr:thiamine-phosphate pyrophosphorylase [Sphingomonadales bacterium]MEA3035213.1 thiamine-phosphate pyrophosphorylase [Sphingomonadales bacterium]
MARRHPLPRVWLITDERQGDLLWTALERLPPGAGIVFRHLSLSSTERRALFRQVKQVARGRGLVLVAAGSPLPGGDGVHNRSGAGINTASAHNLRELRAAERCGADLVFLSPVYATRSHPGGKPLGPRRFALIAHQARVPVIALGGMDAARFHSLGGAYGWAGIDAWTSARP